MMNGEMTPWDLKSKILSSIIANVAYGRRLIHYFPLVSFTVVTADVRQEVMKNDGVKLSTKSNIPIRSCLKSSVTQEQLHMSMIWLCSQCWTTAMDYVNTRLVPWEVEIK